MSHKLYPNDTPFQILDCEFAFKNLTKPEKLYAHYVSRASWEGQFITMFQTSPESPLIFIFFDKLFRSKPTIEQVKNHLREKHSFTDDDIKGLLVFAGAFMANGGNYRGFGDTKFVPNVPSEKLTTVAKEVFGVDFEFFNRHCILPMIDYTDNVRTLGFPPQSITNYWSANCVEKDSEIVTEFLNYKRVDAYNHRVFKTAANTEGNDVDIYEIRFASEQLSSDSDTTDEKLIGHEEEYKGRKFRFTRGDYSGIMPSVLDNLKSAAKNALNEDERKMMEEYVKSFETGSLQAHKQGSRHWIKDKGPVVETYIGFIETYRDPAGARAEFEGFVAVVNKEGSEKLGVLVNHAEEIIQQSMPWPKEFEKDSYLRPDFTALDIISFAGSGVPAGINIPNYDEIRQDEGFKNVHLQNVILANYAAAKISFVSESDVELIKKYRGLAFEVQVGLHELLGHGSGKLFQQKDGKLNFDLENTVNPLTGGKITSYYRDGESYDSIFTSMGSSYEECRAECVGIFLSTLRSVLKVFHVEGAEADEVMYVNWLTMVLSGIRGLESYSHETGKWNQAHSQARYVILRVLLEQAKGMIDIKIVTNKEDGKPDLAITVNRSAIETEGKKAIGDFLTKLQVYKTTADIAKAREMYMGYSEVKEDSVSGHDFIAIRQIITDRMRPRTVLVQSNTKYNHTTGDVDLITYESTAEGFAQSWIDRYNPQNGLYDTLKNLYNKDLKYFPVKN